MKGIWIAVLIIVFFIGALFGYGVGYTPGLTTTVTKTIMVGGESLASLTGLTTQTVTVTIMREKTVTVTTMSGPATPLTTTGGLVMHIGEPTQIRDWEILINSVKEARYIKSDNNYYKPKEGMKMIIVDLTVKNIGRDIENAGEIWSFLLVTDKAKSYEEGYPAHLDYLWSEEVTEEVKEQAIKYELFPPIKNLAPNTSTGRQVIFIIPIDENPVKIFFKVGVFFPVQVEVPLS